MKKMKKVPLDVAGKFFLAQSKRMDRPEQGKIYSLTGATGAPSIANGNSWKESELRCRDCKKPIHPYQEEKEGYCSLNSICKKI